MIENCPIASTARRPSRRRSRGIGTSSGSRRTRIRGGMALVIAEGLALKAPKVQKRPEDEDGRMGMARCPDRRGRESDEEDAGSEAEGQTILRDLIAGPPCLRPDADGRRPPPAARSRNTGFAARG